MSWSEGFLSNLDLYDEEDKEQRNGNGEADPSNCSMPAHVAPAIQGQKKSEYGRNKEEGSYEVDPAEFFFPVCAVLVRKA